MRFLFACLCLCFFVGTASAKNPIYQSAIVYHPETGKIIVDQKGYRKRVPASLVKMMVGLIVMEQVLAGKRSLDEKVTVSRKASRIGGHQVYLKQGEVFTLAELLKATIIGSANDAAYAIAEYVGGSEKAFVKMMNAKAKKLGLKNTTFVNSNGLPPRGKNRYKDNQTNAYDMAKLASALLQYPSILTLTKTEVSAFRHGSFQLLNTNRQFLRSYPGADGLKTGYTRRAGFSMVGTAVQDGERLIVVVMGAKRPKDRLKAARYLLDKGFSTLSKQKMVTAKAAQVPGQTYAVN